MEPGQITAIAVSGLICGTIVIGLVAQAWAASRAHGGGGGSTPKRLDVLEERLFRLEQAIDAVAVEVERGSEAQRFTAKLLAERLAAAPATRASELG